MKRQETKVESINHKYSKLKYVSVVTLMLGLIMLICFSVSSYISAGNRALAQGIILYTEGRYGEAVTYLEEGDGGPLLIGNDYYHIGEGQQDPQQKMTMMQTALETYKKGMIVDSTNIELKFNYEWVLEQLKEEEKQQEQNQENQDQQNQEDQQDEKDQQNQDDHQDGQNQDSEDQNQEEQENQSQNGEDQENPEEENQSESQKQENQQQETEGQQQETEGQQPENEDQQPEGGESVEEGTAQDDQLEQILRLLEAKEEESLKNNQQVIHSGNGDGNDW